jgi:hypothetical protein
MCLFGSAQPFLLLTFLDFCAAIYSNAANSSESLSVASSTSTGNVSHPDYSPTSHLSIFATDPTDNTSNSSQTSFTIASLSDSDVATHSLALPSTPISQPNTRLNDHTITSSPSISSSFTTYGWGNQTSNQTDTPRSAPPLSTYVWGNQTYTQCPIEDADFGYTARDAQCCSYYNSDLSTAVFESWVTAGAAEPSPDVGARYGCCGDCTILVSNIQVLYWPDATAQEWITCSTSYTTYATSLPAGVRCPACATSWDVTEPLYSTADAAYGCNHPAPSPFFTEIGGYTLTSPTPYIRFTSFWPYDWCGKVIGK